MTVRKHFTVRLSTLSAPLLALAFCINSHAARAGGGSLDEMDTDVDRGSPFFGEARDIKSGNSIGGTRVVAELHTGGTSLVTRTDTTGHYRIDGFGKEINPDDVKISCSKDGFKLVDVVRNRLSQEPGAPVEVDCLLDTE